MVRLSSEALFGVHRDEILGPLEIVRERGTRSSLGRLREKEGRVVHIARRRGFESA